MMKTWVMNPFLIQSAMFPPESCLSLPFGHEDLTVFLMSSTKLDIPVTARRNETNKGIGTSS